jgi:hypothetical protein
MSNFRSVAGTALYTANFTPPTAPLTAIANTTLLTCQSNRFVNKSAVSATPSTSGSISVSSGNPFAANTSYASLGSAYFDGTGDYLTTSASSQLSFGTGNFTIECWVYAEGFGASNSGTVFFLGTSGTVFLRYQNTTTWAFYDAGGVRHDYTFNSTNSGQNQWVHHAIVRNSGTTTWYINGASVYSGADTTSYDGTIIDIGQYRGAGLYWNGYISDFRVVKGTAVYTTAFTPPTTPLTAVANTQLLTCQYNGGATNYGLVDSSSWNRIIGREGNTAQGTYSPYSQTGWSNYFDGSGDYLLVTNNTALQLGNTYTVEAWVYLNVYGSNLRIVSDGSSSGNDLDLGVYNTGVIFFAGGYTEVGGGYTLPLGTWVHIAVVVNAGALSIYVNGTARTLVGQTTSFNHTNTGNKIIGAVSGGNNWNGYISNLRFLKGTALYTSNFTPSTTPLTAIANTSLLTCQSNRLIDNSPNNFTITKNGDVSVQAYSPFGGVTSVPTSYSNYFDGTSDYLTIPASTQYNFGTGDFTVEFWINSTDTDAVIAAQLNAGGTNWCILVTGTNLYWQNSYQAVSLLYFSYQLTGQWTHIAYVRRLGTLRCYINGTEAGSISDTTNYAGNGNLQIGSGGYGDLLGYISNFRIVKGTAVYTSNFTPPTSPLTAIANTTLLTCQSSTMIDNSVNKSTITSNGTTVRAVNPFGLTNTTQVVYSPSVNGGSYYFDGTGDKYSITGTPNIQGDYTIECWAWLAPSAAGGNVGIFWVGGVGLYASSTNWRVYTSNASSPFINATIAMTPATTPAGQWLHHAFVRSGSSFRYYINGIQVYTTSDSNVYSQTSTWLGFNADLGYYWTGYISDFRYVNAALYTSNFAPPVSPVTSLTTIGTTPYASSLYLTGTSGGIIDAHGSHSIETVGNTKLAPLSPYAGDTGKSMYFDGTGDYLLIPKNPSLNLGASAYTVEAWFNIDALSGQQTIISFLTGLKITVVTTPALRVWGDAGNTYQNAPATITPGTWYHMAWVRESTSLGKLYLNGSLILTVTSSNIVSSMPTDQDVLVGTYGDGFDNPFKGHIKDLRITKGVARYTSTFTPPTTTFQVK